MNHNELRVILAFDQSDQPLPASPPRFRVTVAHLVVAIIAGFSLFLGLANIAAQGFANLYYAAAVRSMMQNWHAFYFASLDPKGFVSIDKPPLGFWIQTGSALLFGYQGWSILLPQALAAAGSTVVLYTVVRRFFGTTAGVIAALALAISPVNVAVARNNTPDGLLVFALLLACLCFAKAVQSGRALWLMAAFAMVGVGFNIKMMEAYLILPAMVIAYLGSSHVSFMRRIWHLVVATIALVVVSFSWATTVWLTPANRRPYVGSTKDNNVFSLIFGYNGMNRLLPKGWSIFGITNGATSVSPATARGIGPASGRMSENGPQSLFRLFNHQLGGQIGWLIPLALSGLIVAWGRPRWQELDERNTMLALFGVWGATEIAFFSEAGFYHRYYLATLSPAVAALSGIGVVALWNAFRASSWKAVLLPVALAASAATQYRVLAIYPFWQSRLAPALVAGAAVTLAAVFTAWLVRRSTRFWTGRVNSFAALVAAACLLTLFIAPGVWSYVTVNHGSSGALPAAGPSAAASSSNAPHSRGQSASLDAVPRSTLDPKPLSMTRTNQAESGAVLMRFLQAHRGKTAYLVAVPSSREADPIIVNTGEAVMTLGGFSGSDPILTVTTLKHLIKTNQIRFFLFQTGVLSLAPSLAILSSSSAKPSRHATTHETIATWVKQTCKLVAPTTIAAASPGASTSGLGGLYDCQGAASKT
jgi:4-amino-4-deoxy-L-arabinose transferase-like glycosyltransferase